MSEIINILSSYDEQFLLLINGCHSSFFDPVMKTISGKLFWIPFYLLLAVLVFRKGGVGRGILFLLFTAFLITAADQVCATFIRPYVERLRPANLSNPLSEYVHIVDGYRGGSYGFPSCHAANTFALATFISLYFRRRLMTLTMMCWAALVCYSRMYLGVHYPGDITVGAIIGASLAIVLNIIYDSRRSRLLADSLSTRLSVSYAQAKLWFSARVALFSTPRTDGDAPDTHDLIHGDTLLVRTKSSGRRSRSRIYTAQDAQSTPSHTEDRKERRAARAFEPYEYAHD